MQALLREALLLIGEDPDHPDVFHDSSKELEVLKASMLDAMHDVLIATAGYRRKYYLPLASGRNFYKIDFRTDYFLLVHEAIDEITARKLEQKDLLYFLMLDMDWMSHTGTPIYYAQVSKDIICFYPAPSTTGRLIVLDCVCLPKDIAGPASAMQGLYLQAIVYYAVGEFYASRGDARRASEFFNEFAKIALQKRLHLEDVQDVGLAANR
jgi:hypothetical protein